MIGSVPLKSPVASPDSGSERKPRDVVPSHSTPQGGSRRYCLAQPLVTNLANGSYTNNLAAWRTSIPSARLHHKVTTGYAPTSGEYSNQFPQSGAGAWKEDIREWARTDEGVYVPGGLIVQGLVLPNSWEAITMSAEWRGVVTVPTGGTGVVPGILWVVAEWEIPAGESPMPDDELELLFSACRLQVDAALIVFQAGT